MKIKEVESLTNMSRDNIRFYEKCGLIQTNRNENGYREYSDEDVKILKRIKLLRSLHLSIDDIKEIQNNKIELINCLDENIKQLEEQKIDLDKSMNTCKQMILDHVTYNNLDASKYLQHLDMNAETDNLKEDTIPKLKAPIRRYIARTIDYNLYNLIIQCFVILILNVRTVENVGLSIIVSILTILLMLFIEPFLLSKFSTTLGKWLLGLKITDEDGNHLTYKDAFNRTIEVIIYGCGLYIPFIFLICYFVSYRKLNKNEELAWEEGNTYLTSDIHLIHIIRTLIYWIIYLIITVLLVLQSYLPPNRGELTIHEFAQNYNYTQAIHGEGSYATLDSNGNWIEKKSEDGVVIAPIIDRYPQLYYVVDNDEVVEINFSIENESNTMYFHYADKITKRIILSYLTAQDNYSILNSDAGRIAMMFSVNNDCKYEAYGIEIIQTYIESEQDSNSHSLFFTIRKIQK